MNSIDGCSVKKFSIVVLSALLIAITGCLNTETTNKNFFDESEHSVQFVEKSGKKIDTDIEEIYLLILVIHIELMLILKY